MSEGLQRRKLTMVPAGPTAPPDPAAIAAVAARHGFAEPAVPALPIDEPKLAAASPQAAGQGAGQDGVRRRRPPTGRDHQFNTRLRLETRDLIYGEANARNIPVAQVIEEAMAALVAQRPRG